MGCSYPLSFGRLRGGEVYEGEFLLDEMGDCSTWVE